LKGLLQKVFPLEKEDWAKALPLSAFFFLVIITFWVLKPIKRGMMVHYFADSPLKIWGMTFHGAQTEQLGKVLNVIAIYFAVVLFTWLVKKFPRHYLVLIFGVVFSGLFLIYSYLLKHQNGPVVVSFFVLGDVYVTVMVALFWSFTNDIASPQEAKRTYGFIGLGGVVGGFVGASIVESKVQDVGPSFLLLGCIIPMVAVVILAFWVQAKEEKKTHEEGPAATPTKTSEIWEGGKLVFASRYLLAIAGLVLIYEITANLIDFQLASTIETSIPDALKKDAFFGTVGVWTGIASIITQIFLTSWVLDRLGVRVALSFLPVSIFFTSLGFLIFPVLAMVTAMSSVTNAISYSINQSSKEALYTPTPRDAIYKAKAFIDMFVQRFAKGLAVFLNLAFVAFTGANVRWLSLLALALTMGYYGLISFVGKEFKKDAGQVKKAA